MLALTVCSFLVAASGVAAHGFDLVDTLPKCWQKSLKATSNGCDSQSCICDASQSDSYLPSAAKAIIANCDVDQLVLDATFLFPVEAYCNLAGNPIPESVMSAAYGAATATYSTPPLTTRKLEHSQKSQSHPTTKAGEDLKSTVTTTHTQTTTDKNGNTLEIIIPIVIGPNTISTGKIITSTLDAKATPTNALSSAAASPSPTEAPAPASTQTQQVASPTTAAKSGKTSNNNGSPFENMQAGAGRWGVPGVLTGIGFLAGVFMRL